MEQWVRPPPRQLCIVSPLTGSDLLYSPSGTSRLAAPMRRCRPGSRRLVYAMTDLHRHQGKKDLSRTTASGLSLDAARMLPPRSMKVEKPSKSRQPSQACITLDIFRWVGPPMPLHSPLFACLFTDGDEIAWYTALVEPVGLPSGRWFSGDAKLDAIYLKDHHYASGTVRL
ncbi:hypothetical protein OIDMADRAFT_60055 [Oidiodendron maius Zn]|uniref:Uncharacterized protein n=1 Tax=Oidiodendron maius (strain Zn) TaxID=913774 RepID=A0A0C3GFJ9_OIDMZ|nr:hypothetical protein OIDMADRAFT_60055 [Oidiodendron maius Zn]